MSKVTKVNVVRLTDKEVASICVLLMEQMSRAVDQYSKDYAVTVLNELAPIVKKILEQSSKGRR